ncbi:hypothetical protein [Scleromatobacter humisilvae]|uniref:Uncharacterized protein n=1 Tax=Scleromatobacter humisilvae TaxID=2897159 RepID=A0A9X1YRI7_9BURK|nr:hypothetical protein [Scleromatobacter humisilvae]MCK9687351.1 hypothetical protein [Scleromatobacter humisilvae]
MFYKATPAKLRTWLAWLAGFGTAVTGVAFYAYLAEFGKLGFSNEHTRWAEFGTYIGGTVGPIAAFVGSVAVALTVIAQVKQIEDATEKSMSDRVESERLAKTQRETLEAMQAQVEHMAKQARFTEEHLQQSKAESERYAQIQAEMVTTMREQAVQLAATARIATLTSALAEVRVEIDSITSVKLNQDSVGLRAAQSRQISLRGALAKALDGLQKNEGLG